MRMGQDGPALLKPEDDGGLMIPELSETGDSDGMISMDIYDQIDEIKKKN